MISTISDWLLCDPFCSSAEPRSVTIKDLPRGLTSGGEMADTRVTTCSPSKLRKQDEMEFRLIFTVSFAFFLVAAVIARCLPRGWRFFPPGAEGRRSIIGDAKAAANSTIPYAFMG